MNEENKNKRLKYSLIALGSSILIPGISWAPAITIKLRRGKIAGRIAFLFTMFLGLSLITVGILMK
jgi:hypothetical protein